MRRTLASTLALLILWSSLPVAPAAAQAEPAAAAADPLADLLDARELKQTRNPVVASFLAGEGAALVPEELRERALVQLRGALKSQANAMNLMLAGVSGVMGSDTMKKQQEWARKQSKGKLMAVALLGVGPVAPPMPSGDQMERETQQALTDPWVRGIEAAKNGINSSPPTLHFCAGGAFLHDISPFSTSIMAKNPISKCTSSSCFLLLL